MRLDLPYTALNFRALGGFASGDGRIMKTGLLFRTGDLSAMTPDDMLFMQRKSKIRFYYDLRNDKEIAPSEFESKIQSAGICRRHFPMEGYDETFSKILHPTPDDYVQVYMQMLKISGDVIAEFFQSIAQNDHFPLAFGCFAGKDRTGVLTALILDSIGIPWNAIARDYALSSKYLMENSEHFSEKWKSLGITKEEYAPRLSPKKETMMAFLHRYRSQFGGSRSYLKKVGVNRATLKSIQERLLKE